MGYTLLRALAFGASLAGVAFLCLYAMHLHWPSFAIGLCTGLLPFGVGVVLIHASPVTRRLDEMLKETPHE